MLGAIVGDIVGSRFECTNYKSKEFELFHPYCRPTDDSNMTLAIALAVTTADGNPDALPAYAVKAMQRVGRRYSYGFGERFEEWIFSNDPQPYNSWGNGAAMRVSPCAWAARSLEEALMLSDAVTGVTHNHPEGMKGARAVTAAVYLARIGCDKAEIREHIRENYYPLDFTLDEIRPAYHFDVSCQGSVPQAIEAFLESDSFEDAIRNAVSIGGDSDTIAAIAGSIAEAYYGVPEEMRAEALKRLDEPRRDIYDLFYRTYVAGHTPRHG